MTPFCLKPYLHPLYSLPQYFFGFLFNTTRISRLFTGDFDISRIITGLEIESDIKIDPRNTLILFDEIQESPEALAFLKYFYEKAPQYNIIAAGSMLGVALHKGTSFPVGKVEFLNLFPLNFCEFLDALGEKSLLGLLEKQDWPLITTFKDCYINLLRSYYFGGMPEVVNDFVAHKDYSRVRELQKNILNAYEQDFSKHVPVNMATKVRMIWNSVLGQLSKENKKFIYGALKKGARAKEYESALTWLGDNGLIYRINRVNTAQMPLKSYEDLEAFKVFVLDVGLLSAMGDDISAKILLDEADIFTQFKGSLTEQYVLQQIKSIGNIPINYWTNNNATSELDFVIQLDNAIVPVEVKSSENLKAKSLKVYMEKFHPEIAVRTSTADYKKNESLHDIPLYAAEQIKSAVGIEKTVDFQQSLDFL